LRKRLYYLHDFHRVDSDDFLDLEGCLILLVPETADLPESWE
jgi:hypothetical protein